MKNDGIFTRGRPAKYPWDVWTNGEIHTALRGRDFKCRIDSFTKTLWEHGYKRNLRCQLKVEGTQVTFRYSPSQPARRSPKARKSRRGKS